MQIQDFIFDFFSDLFFDFDFMFDFIVFDFFKEVPGPNLWAKPKIMHN